jgi:hypothetical protein
LPSLELDHRDRLKSLIRGFDPVADTTEFGRELIPRIKAGAIDIDKRATPAAPAGQLVRGIAGTNAMLT